MLVDALVVVDREAAAIPLGCRRDIPIPSRHWNSHWRWRQFSPARYIEIDSSVVHQIVDDAVRRFGGALQCGLHRCGAFVQESFFSTGILSHSYERRYCFWMHDGSVSLGRLQEFAHTPHVVRDPRFHRGRDAERLVHASEIVKREPHQDCCRVVFPTSC